ncbi:MAG: hypothetical protein JXL81_10375 [Deltaproteobacteria bacterium]|nr:hypothetical protein [Deltaproteobacteria bacterium]
MIAHQYIGIEPLSIFINTFFKVGFELLVVCFTKENSVMCNPEFNSEPYTTVSTASHMINGDFTLCP